jgi:hypothetical protein
MVAKYFSEYPDTNTDYLKAFQLEIQQFVAEQKQLEFIGGEDNGTPLAL